MKKPAAPSQSFPGIATHYKPEGSRTTACGLIGMFFTSPLAREVDCKLCRRTKLFKDYAI